jgi:uncharacterized protein (TIGR00661 family)
MQIIYGICSWGLGHATRSLPIIRKLINENNNITIISHGRSLDLLKRELGGKALYKDIKDYPILLSENSRQFMAKSVIYWPNFIRRIEAGLMKLSKILNRKKYDLIISDARYDMYSKKIPSFFISHQMRIMNPLRIKIFETGSELFNLFFFKRFSGILVPDYKHDSLSGDLSHNLKKIDENRLYYIGALSDFKKRKIKKDIDYLISISGPEPQRSILEEKVVGQIEQIEGKIAITLGKVEQISKIKNKNITTYSFLTKDERERVLNRAKIIVSRSGYSTIMDLGIMNTKALMIPTPGQIEQEYLGKYHNNLGTFYSVNQNKIELKRDIEIAKETTGIKRECNVEKSVENVIDIVHSIN